MQKKGYLILGVLVISLITSGCALMNIAPQEKADSTVTENDNDNVIPVETAEDRTDSQDIVINTSYGTLFFPDQWEDLISTNEEKVDDNVKVTFSTTINDNTYELFDVIIGEDQEESVGFLTDSNGKKRSVIIQFHEIAVDAELTENEQKRLYAMQEDLNYLIEKLQ